MKSKNIHYGNVFVVSVCLSVGRSVCRWHVWVLTCKATVFYLLDYISFSGNSKCRDREKINLKIELGHKMYQLFLLPSKNIFVFDIQCNFQHIINPHIWYDVVLCLNKFCRQTKDFFGISKIKVRAGM